MPPPPRPGAATEATAARPAAARPAANAAFAGPPAGNVPLVACPSVCTDQVAGAISSTESATPSAALRTRGSSHGRERRGGEHARPRP